MRHLQRQRLKVPRVAQRPMNHSKACRKLLSRAMCEKADDTLCIHTEAHPSSSRSTSIIMDIEPEFNTKSIQARTLFNQTFISPQRTTSSPNGYHCTFFNLAADIGSPSSPSRLAGETTTPPCPSHVGAIVKMTRSTRAM